MSGTPNRTPAQRRAARAVTATVVAGGLALAGGSAYAQSRDAGAERPVPVAAAPVAEPVAVPAGEPVARDGADDVARQTYFAAGYTYDDAVVLGAQWNLDPFEAKAEAGRRLTDGQTLPVAPGSSPVAVDGSVAAVDAFYAAGYTYDDAVVLGAQWNLDSFEAKAEAGRRLTAGQTLPVAPGSSPVADPVAGDGSSDAVGAFFAAGYTYDDAVALAAVWSVEPYEAKVAAGQRILAGETLPVVS
ncbi:hypothetical protein AB2L28_17465 [Kineococcus sp. TBRC 1896]|uniref:LysM domain-containing protein n=1 Tax=Kineococcus mangrovi TaxID=1660183 RepID=A0ABV4I5R5_9ACTN